MKKRPLGIDLFAGAGGLSLGFEQAGFDVVGAVEFDPIHCAVHAFNFPNCTVIPQSVSNISGTEILDQIGREKIDVVFGGAPCQGFSMIGKRALDDSRNSLVRDFVRLISEIEPGWFVFENVKGLTVGKHRRFLDELIKEFERVGYSVRQPWRVLNAASFGVPQNRERLFLMGSRQDLNVPEYPEPTHCPPGNGRNLFCETGPTCRDALEDLPDAETFEELWSIDAVATTSWGTPSLYAKKMRCLDGSGWYYGYVRQWDKNLLTSSMRTNHTRISRRRFAETKAGRVEPISRFFRLPEDGVSNTLRAGTDASRGAFTSPRPIHYRSSRCITVREMARLHGFPDWFRFHVTKWHGARQIGNSVPPPLGRAVAKSILDAIGGTPRRPRKTVKLGDPSLLTMDMSQAAKYWEVPVPICKRDRKSGATKRKQEDIEVERLGLKA